MGYYQVADSKQIQLAYIGENGIDHGGLVREWMMGWEGNGIGEEHLFIGKILGICFKQNLFYGGFLDIAMFVAITNFPVSLKWIRTIDESLYNSLNYINCNDPEPLCLSFSV